MRAKKPITVGREFKANPNATLKTILTAVLLCRKRARTCPAEPKFLNFRLSKGRAAGTTVQSGRSRYPKVSTPYRESAEKFSTSSHRDRLAGALFKRRLTNEKFKKF